MPRITFVDWLRPKIDNKEYPGLRWTNREETEFSIGWKDVDRPDFRPDTDAKLFQDWAWRNKDKYKNKDGGRPSQWKKIFYEALNDNHFTLVSDKSGDVINPHKVYRWPGKGAQGLQCASPRHNTSHDDSGLEELDDSFQNMKLKAKDEEMVKFVKWLELKIGDKSYPGLCWTNSEKTEFSVGWNDADKHFEDWACRYGDKSGPAGWKKIFKQGLKNNHFTLLSDKSGDVIKPHMVYRWPEKGADGNGRNPGQPTKNQLPPTGASGGEELVGQVDHNQSLTPSFSSAADDSEGPSTSPGPPSTRNRM